MRQFKSYTCKHNLVGTNIFAKASSSYCNFVPWYSTNVGTYIAASFLLSNTVLPSSTTAPHTSPLPIEKRQKS